MRDRQNDDGIIQAFVLDGKGGGVPLGWNEIRAWKPGQGVLWLHLDYTSDAARRWIQQESGLDGIVGEALLSEETRPRATFIDGAALLALRGVNLNPGADPEDMVSIRIWLDKDRIVSTRKRRMLSATDIAEALASGDGPKSPGEFIAQLTQRLTARMEHIVEDLEDRAAQLEEEVISGGSAALRNALSAIRRDTIMLRRYLAPQREAMIKLYSEKVDWLDDADKLRLREATDRLIRHIEDLDSIRERSSVTQEELINRMTEQMNARMYVLSLVAALFLPIGFFTGLLGVNVGGIPGAENNWGFGIFVIILVLIALIQILFFKRKGWF